MNKEINIGDVFGLWTIIGYSDSIIEKNGKVSKMWLCRCKCNKTIKPVREKTLLNGKSLSCGCMRSKSRNINTYDVSGDYGVGYTSNGNEFYFDIEDYEKIKKYNWYMTSVGYIATCYKDENGNIKTLLMHRLIMDVIKYNHNIVDHINHNTVDNRKSNLRIVTHQQSGMNRGIPINNKSGVCGVFIGSDNRWTAAIKINGKPINLGHFDIKQDAIKARKEAEEKYFGEYAYNANLK